MLSLITKSTILFSKLDFILKCIDYREITKNFNFWGKIKKLFLVIFKHCEKVCTVFKNQLNVAFEFWPIKNDLSGNTV